MLKRRDFVFSSRSKYFSRRFLSEPGHTCGFVETRWGIVGVSQFVDRCGVWVYLNVVINGFVYTWHVRAISVETEKRLAMLARQFAKQMAEKEASGG